MAAQFQRRVAPAILAAPSASAYPSSKAKGFDPMP
jgi:hypothetical protein